MDLNTSYLVLGQHLSQMENPAYAMTAVPQVQASFGARISLPKVDLAAKAKDFLKAYWPSILKESCDWWGKNKDQYTGASQISALAAVIAPVIPAPWGLIATVLAIIAVILIRAGLNALCQNLPSSPPS
jgi:hypothetical protein